MAGVGCAASAPRAVRSLPIARQGPVFGRRGVVLPAVPGRGYCAGARYPDRVPQASAGGGRDELLRVARPVDAVADEPLGPAARPRLAPRREPHADVSAVRHTEPGGRHSPLLGRILPARGRAGGEPPRANQGFRHLRGAQHGAGAAGPAGLRGDSARAPGAECGHAGGPAARAVEALAAAAGGRQSAGPAALRDPGAVRQLDPSAMRAGGRRSWSGGAIRCGGWADTRPSTRAGTRC